AARRGAVRPAARRPTELAPRVVVSTGRGEAEAMLAAWSGRRDVELLAEPTARITAHNAARTLPLRREGGGGGARVVCGRAHAPRVRFFFRHLYGRYGVATEIRPAPSTFHPT